MDRVLALLIAVWMTPGMVADSPRTNVGVLTCTVAGGDKAEAGNLTCGFSPTGAGAEEKYVGTVVRSGAAQAGKQVLIWAVLGPVPMQSGRPVRSRNAT